MSQVTRFQEWAHDFMQPGSFYDYVPYDWEGTDRAVLAKFDAWRAANPDVQVLSITGPLRVHVPAGGGASDGVYMELTVLHE